MDQRLDLQLLLGLLDESQISEEQRRGLLALAGTAVPQPFLPGFNNDISQLTIDPSFTPSAAARTPFSSSFPSSASTAAASAAESHPVVPPPALPAAANPTPDKHNLFPYVLQGLLDDVEKACQTSVISWSPDGRAFCIHEVTIFQNKLLRLYFQQSSMEEFRTTLLSWGFIEDEDRLYHHPCFLRNSPELRVFMTKAEASRDTLSPTKEFPSKEDESEASSEDSRTAKEQASEEVSALQTKGPGNFLTRLRSVFQKTENEGSQQVIGWQPHGRAFKVYDRQTFTEGLLSECMDSNSYGAFQRVLRRWGFVRIKQGHDEGAHFHRLFSRDDPSLCQDMAPRQMRDAMAGEFVGETDFDNARKTKEQKGIAQASAPALVNKKRPLDKSGTSLESGGKRRVASVQSADQGGVKEALPIHPPGMLRVNEVYDQADVFGLMFPWSLHHMLDDAEKASYKPKQIVSWQPDGVSFTIRDRELFMSELLPKYFEETSWSAFTKKLSSWGFVCFTSGAQKGAFIHRLLVRGKQSLCKLMRYQGKTVADMLKNRGAFIVRLHETLTILQQEGKESIAGWSQDGKSFTIYDPSTFLGGIFSSYFDSLTISTFEQKLKSWGFLREPMYYSSGKVSYSHPFFAREKKPEIVRAPERILAVSLRIDHGFLVRLRVLLNDAHRHGHQTVVSWLSHGKAFMVHDRPCFSNKMMPYYFRAKFTSFRQLLRKHGFSQMGGNGWDEGAYYHCLFVRDDPMLSQGTTQQQMKDAMPDWIPASEEPNFYIEDEPETKPNAVASTEGAISSKKKTVETSES